MPRRASGQSAVALRVVTICATAGPCPAIIILFVGRERSRPRERVMRRRSDIFWSIVIVLIVAGAIWVVTGPRFPIRLGLDLQGGLQVLLEADVAEDVDVTAEAMDTARQIIWLLYTSPSPRDRTRSRMPSSA